MSERQAYDEAVERAEQAERDDVSAEAILAAHESERQTFDALLAAKREGRA